MKITIFTGNQLRHKSFVNSLTRNGHEVIAFLEVSTLFQGEKSGIYSKSQLVKRYMRKVKESEKLYFGDDGNYVESAKSFPMLLGELSDIDKGDLLEALNADL